MKLLFEKEFVMNPIIEKIRNTIKNTEFEKHSYLVGGYVRDKIMGIEHSNDIDIVVNLPYGGIKLAEYLYKKNISTKPKIYKNFGTAIVKIDNTNIELVMTRKESYRSNSRKPEVKPASIYEDALRRDFTINAIYQKINDGKILDITKRGIEDIKKKIIRTVKNADLVFKEDPLRMLRAIKFSVKLNFEIEKKTLNSIKNNYRRLEIVSIERIRDEFNSIITSPNPISGINLLIETKLMKYIIPEIYEIINLPQNKYHDKDVFQHTLEVVKEVPNTLLLRISALLHDIGKGRTFSIDKNGRIHFYGHENVGAEMAKNILKRLKYPNNFIKLIYLLIKNHLRTKQYGKKAEIVTDKTLRKFIDQTKGFTEELLLLIDADNKAHSKNFSLPEQVKHLKKRISLLKKDMINLPINGNDIKKIFNINEGKEVGELLKRAKDLWLENPKISKEELLKKLQQLQ